MDARLVQLEKWLTILFRHPFAEVCLFCPPTDLYFRAREERFTDHRGLVRSYYVPDVPADSDPVLVRRIWEDAAVIAVALALRGIGLDPQRVAQYIREHSAGHSDFRIEEGARNFGCCLMGKEFLAAVEALLKQSASMGTGSSK